MPADVMTPNSVLNTRKLHECDMNAACVDVTTANVALGIRVRRGRVWNKKWRDDLDDSSAANPRPRLTGTVVGFTDAGGALVGRNSGREFATDCITEASGPGWAVVEWLPSSSPTPPHARKRSVYPIGFMGAYSLVFADAPEDRGAVDAVDVGELYRSALEGGAAHHGRGGLHGRTERLLRVRLTRRSTRSLLPRVVHSHCRLTKSFALGVLIER